MKHLKSHETAILREELEQKRLELRKQIRDELTRNSKEHYGDVAGSVHDIVDDSVADLLSDINATVVSRYIRELRDVEAAQERMHEGEYGVCDECGEDIPFARLRAYPTATRCVLDQERHEELYSDGENSGPNM